MCNLKIICCSIKSDCTIGSFSAIFLEARIVMFLAWWKDLTIKFTIPTMWPSQQNPAKQENVYAVLILKFRHHAAPATLAWSLHVMPFLKRKGISILGFIGNSFSKRWLIKYIRCWYNQFWSTVIQYGTYTP